MCFVFSHTSAFLCNLWSLNPALFIIAVASSLNFYSSSMESTPDSTSFTDVSSSKAFAVFEYSLSHFLACFRKVDPKYKDWVWRQKITLANWYLTMFLSIVIPQSSLGISIPLVNVYLQEGVLMSPVTRYGCMRFLRTISNNSGCKAGPVSTQSLRDGCSGFCFAEQSHTILSLVVSDSLITGSCGA